MFTTTLSLRELERLMQGVPHFPPRGHGVFVLCRHEYSKADCDCRYCPHFTGKGENRGCSLDWCVCIKERIKAGTASRKETLLETVSAIRCAPFIGRLNQYLKESEESPMIFKNEKHRAVFAETVRKLDRKNNALMAAVYLLTADHKLWLAAKRHVERNRLRLEGVRLQNSGEEPTPCFAPPKISASAPST